MDTTFEITLPSLGRVTLTRAMLPDSFLAWQSQARINMFKAMMEGGGQSVTMAPVHLPVLASLDEGIFPVNLATRGIGVLPKDEILAKITERFQKAQVHVERSKFGESLTARAKVAQDFYTDSTLFNPYILGGLEIFEGTTAKNLQKNPVATLLYTGEAPKFPSFQLHGIVEFVKPGNSYYEFLLAARELFAFDHFHVTQHKYPYGYLFHVVELKDKTPVTRK